MLSRLAPLVPALLLCTVASAAEQMPASDARFAIEGRYDSHHGTDRTLAFPGIRVAVNFEGTELSMEAEGSSEEVFWDLQVDGGGFALFTFPKGPHTLALAQGLKPGPHRVELVKRVEGHVGTLTVNHLVTDGKFTAPLPPRQRHLLAMGDSFTCGQATEVRPGLPISPVKARRQNARLAYPCLLGERFQAEVHLIGFAGKGLFRDWEGKANGPFPEDYYQRAVAQDPESRWNAARWIPDVFVICIGSNDFDAGIPEHADYVAHYIRFLTTLRRDAPKARVYLLNSPILRDVPGKEPKRSAQLAYLKEIAAAVPLTQVVITEPYDVVPGDWHPDGVAHEKIAELLATHLQADLGW